MSLDLSLTPTRREKYVSLASSAITVHQDKLEAEVNRIRAGRARYESVAVKFGIRWEIIGVIHSMEASCNFSKHLHNGDPLTARTVRVPVGRPRTGTPPFTWEQSAIDVISDRLPWSDWSLAGTLYFLESYNGHGYFSRGINTPYLWSGTTAYQSGLFVKDGLDGFSRSAVSGQIGCVPLLKQLGYQYGVDVQEVVDKPIAFGESSQRVKSLQAFLNSITSSDLMVDGVAGQYTSNAFHRVVGRYLHGDPRGEAND